MHRCDPRKKKIEQEEEEGAHPRIPGLGPPYAEGHPKKKKGKKNKKGPISKGTKTPGVTRGTLTLTRAYALGPHVDLFLFNPAKLSLL